MAHEHERGRIKQFVFRQSLLNTLRKNGFLPELPGREQRPFIPGVIHETTASGMVVFQSPRVKSGNSTGIPPWAMERAVNGSREDQEAPS